MIRLQFFVRGLIFALIVCSCSIEINQTTQVSPSPVIEETPAAVPTDSLPTTQIPVTWSHLNLTGKLVYISSRNNDNLVVSNVQMLDLMTGDISTLFSVSDAWIYYATLSPDAKILVMSYAPPAPANTPSTRILYLLPLDAATEPQPLFTPPTADDRYTQVEWSPDGMYIYFVHYDNKIRLPGQLDPVYHIFRMRYPDGPSEEIATNAFWPRISPDSSQLVYITIDPDTGRNDLFLANADGSNPRQVAFTGPGTEGIIDAPIFSPDGQSILISVPSPAQSYQPNLLERFMGIQVAKAHDVPSDWWSVPISGGAPTQLTNIQTINLFASISPDQQHVASLSGDGIFVMNLDGSNLTQLVSDPGVHGTVRWIP
jgi:Tol biopolymer transport system component